MQINNNYKIKRTVLQETVGTRRKGEADYVSDKRNETMRMAQTAEKTVNTV